MKTPEEILQYINSDNQVTIDETENTNSFKSNYFLINRNFKRINEFLATTSEFVKNIYSIIDVNSITNDVLNNISVAKQTLNLSLQIAIDSAYVVEFGTTIYRVKKISEFVLEVTNESVPTWNVDNLIVSTKATNGQQIQTKITTFENKILIDFENVNTLGTTLKLLWI